MAAVVLKDIPVNVNVEKAKKDLHIKDHTKMSQIFDDMIKEGNEIVRPKAVFNEAFVNIEEDFVVIDGIKFKSRVMYSNLKDVGRVFAYAATCGTEIDEWSNKFSANASDQYMADKIKQLYLYDAVKYFKDYIISTYELGKSATMNPGSLPDWPISEQAKLLPIIGDVEKLIGMTLTKSFLLVPLKSVSGIMFPSEVNYVNCKLCTKKDCPGRKAKFDEVMYREKLGLNA